MGKYHCSHCRKDFYNSLTHAYTMALRMSVKTGLSFRVYKCPYTKKRLFHLTKRRIVP